MLVRPIPKLLGGGKIELSLRNKRKALEFALRGWGIQPCGPSRAERAGDVTLASRHVYAAMMIRPAATKSGLAGLSDVLYDIGAHGLEADYSSFVTLVRFSACAREPRYRTKEPPPSLHDCPLHNARKELPTSLLTSSARLGAYPAVLMHLSVPLALVPTRLAGGGACLQQRLGHVRSILSSATCDPRSGNTDIRAIQAESNAPHELRHVRLGQVCVGAANAGLDAVVERVNGGAQQVDIHIGVAWAAVQHLPRIAHLDLLQVWATAPSPSPEEFIVGSARPGRSVTPPLECSQQRAPRFAHIGSV